MENYLRLIPSELIEILISYLNYDDFNSLTYNYSFNLDWNIVFKYHFNYYKTINRKEYKRYLGIESLKNKLKLKQSIEYSIFSSKIIFI